MARPRQFSLVFDQIKLARPSKLFLYQDGPRQNHPDDLLNILKCREIATNIDWDCEVNRFYQETNYGCDPSEYLAQKWFFSYVDQGIVLEDDDVPSQSFFPFCKEMLERYANDERINFIAGMNHLGEYSRFNESYFFSSTCSIWGWATWKRTIDQWDDKLSFLNDSSCLELLKINMGKKLFNNKMKSWITHKNLGIPFYESILDSSVLLNSQFNIIPAKNLISNIGISESSTHSSDTLKKLPRKIRKLFFMKTYELEFPLKHPKYILIDNYYSKKVNKILANGYPLIKYMRRIETKIYKSYFMLKNKIGVLNKR
jgi:hypothetical protein